MTCEGRIFDDRPRALGERDRDFAEHVCWLSESINMNHKFLALTGGIDLIPPNLEIVFFSLPNKIIVSGDKRDIQKFRSTIEDMSQTVLPPDFIESLRKDSSILCKKNEHTNVLNKKSFTMPDRTSSFEFIAETNLPTHSGEFRMRAYRASETSEQRPLGSSEPIAMIRGHIEGKSDVILRVHDQCATSEIFGSLKCDCKDQLDNALDKIQKEEGIVIYLPQEGRGIGIANKIAAYAVQELGIDTVDANRLLGLPDDVREYSAVKFILDDLDIKSVRLLTNNPRKIEHLESLGIKVTERIPCIVDCRSHHSQRYLDTKVERMNHLI